MIHLGKYQNQLKTVKFDIKFLMKNVVMSSIHFVDVLSIDFKMHNRQFCMAFCRRRLKIQLQNLAETSI
jgi:hypothetical protein